MAFVYLAFLAKPPSLYHASKYTHQNLGSRDSEQEGDREAGILTLHLEKERTLAMNLKLAASMKWILCSNSVS